jgi:hypothetical protein
MRTKAEPSKGHESYVTTADGFLDDRGRPKKTRCFMSARQARIVAKNYGGQACGPQEPVATEPTPSPAPAAPQGA